jgi:hypothetical protein
VAIFDKILERHNLTKHDGRPIWQYKITPEEYKALKESISHSLARGMHSACATDSVVFAAEWWKTEYSGGPVSWINIVEAFGRSGKDFQKDFETACKIGAQKLSINWIKLTNTHYLRTLLVQGGFPINILLRNSGNLSHFLDQLMGKVLQYGSEQIDTEWINSSYIHKTLPQSFRNGSIYQLALQTVTAIINEDDSSLPFDSESNSALLEIVSKLKEGKKRVRNTGAGVRFQWELSINNGTGNLYYTPLADQILTTSFIQRNSIPEDASDVRFFAQDIEFARYRRTAGGELMLFKSRLDKKIWSGDSMIQCTITTDDVQTINYCAPGQSAPDLKYPFLMCCSDSNDLIIEKTNRVGYDQAILYLPDQWSVIDETESVLEKKSDISILDVNGSLIEFMGRVLLSRGDDREEFNTECDTKQNEISFSNNLPSWIIKSNKIILTDFPAFNQYDENGLFRKVNRQNITWRHSRSVSWRKFDDSFLEPGNLIFRVDDNSSHHLLRAFYLGENISVESVPESPRKGEIRVSGFTGLIKPKTGTVPLQSEVIRQGNSVKIKLEAVEEHFPPAKIELEFETTGNSDKVIIEVAPPFLGAYFADPAGAILELNQQLCVNTLAGYRLVCVGDHYKVIFKNSYPFTDINKSIEVSPGTYQLFKFEEIISTFFQLYDPLDTDNWLQMSVVDRNGKLSANIRFVQYNCSTGDGVPFQIYESHGCRIDDLLPVKGFHLGDMEDGISETFMTICNGTYDFKPDALPGPWIVHCQNTDTFKLRPTLKMCRQDEKIHTNNPICLLNQIHDPNQRRAAIAEILKTAQPYSLEWNTTTQYFKILMQNDLPSVVLDYFRVVAEDPVLMVRFFISAQSLYSTDSEMASALLLMEESLPLLWHHIPITIWIAELNTLSVNDDTGGLRFIKIFNRVHYFISELFPYYRECNASDIIFGMITNPGRKEEDPGRIPIDWITELRQRVGLIENLPTDWYSSIYEEWRYLFDVTGFQKEHWPLLLAPFRGALIVSGHSFGYWTQPLKMKRIQYYRKLAPVWYDKAFSHLLRRIIAHKGIFDGFQSSLSES